MAPAGGRADKGLGEEGLYRGLGSDINRSGHSADVDGVITAHVGRRNVGKNVTAARCIILSLLRAMYSGDT